jgi:hypothetical protein
MTWSAVRFRRRLVGKEPAVQRAGVPGGPPARCAGSDAGYDPLAESRCLLVYASQTQASARPTAKPVPAAIPAFSVLAISSPACAPRLSARA